MNDDKTATPFTDDTFERVIAHMRNGADMFDATAREGHTPRQLFDFIAAHRAAGGADYHPLLYLARADALATRAVALTDELAADMTAKRIRSKWIAAEWRQAADRLLAEARTLRDHAAKLAYVVPPSPPSPTAAAKRRRPRRPKAIEK